MCRKKIKGNMYIHQSFLWFHLGTCNWHEHMAERVIPDWEPAQESWEGCAVYHTWKVSEKKCFPLNHFHLVVFSQWSRIHIIELANSTIFFLTNNTDLQLDVKGKLHVYQYNSSQETLKRPEYPEMASHSVPTAQEGQSIPTHLHPCPKEWEEEASANP